MSKLPVYAVRELTCSFCKATVSGRFKKERKYCSKECSVLGRAESRKTGHFVPCMQCGAEHYKRKCELNKNGNFCSYECANNFQGRNKTTHTCKICKKLFKLSPSRHKNNNIKYCSIPCRNADRDWSEQLRLMNNIQQMRKITSCERLGYGLLDEIGVVFERQHMVEGRFCVDAYISSRDIALQFDGDYWHANPSKYKTLDERQRKRVRLDHSQDAFMASRGIRVFRAWHSDLKNNIDVVKERLLSLLAE